MIFRIDKNTKELYEIYINKINEKEFVKLNNKNGLVYIYISNYKYLPKLEKDIYVNKTYYKLDKNNNIIVDEDKTIKEWKNDKKKNLENTILLQYKQDKQMSDISDKLWYEQILKQKSYNVTELLEDGYIEYLKQNKDLEKTINSLIKSNKIKQEDVYALEQIAKTMLRVMWVQECKEEYKKSIKEIREPEYKKLKV